MSIKKVLVVSLMLPVLLLAMGCPLPISPPHSTQETTSPPAATGQSGSLSVNVTAAAPWLWPLLGQGGSKAFLFATSVKVSLKTSGGSDVISPVTLSLSLDASGSGAGTSTLDTINNIPAGSNYTLKVDLYNSVVSTTTAMVEGQATVSITTGNTTSTTVVCTPLGATSISVGSLTPVTQSLAQYGEKWYSIVMGAGTYTINQTGASTASFLFTPAGELIGQVSVGTPYTYPCATAGTYFLGVAGLAAATSSVTVSGPPSNEGSIASPVAVTLDAARTFKIGVSAAAQDYSYYTFTTTSAGTYYFDVSQLYSYYLYVYTNSDFTGSVVSSVNGAWGVGFSLTGSTTYYLKLRNTSSSVASFSGMVVDPAYAASHTQGEGSVASPIGLTPEVGHAATLGWHAYDYKSYYTFTTGSDTDFTFSISGYAPSGTYLYAYVGTDSTYASYSSSGYLSSSSTFTASLSPSTQYYLLLVNETYPYTTAATATLLAHAAPTVITPLSLSTLTVGQLLTSSSVVWYEVSGLTPGASYAVFWDDSFAGSGTYTGDLLVDAYHQDRVTTYWTGMDSAYTTPVSVIVAGTDTKFYLRVRGFGGDTGTFGIRVDPNGGSLAITVH
ncbi:MAG TPA: hypothetical protein VFH83_07685 [Spirochaetia bacterium]|nr:hypothetical protein [Spirochaetia bacterium]